MTLAEKYREKWTSLLDSPEAEREAIRATYANQKEEMISLSVLASLSGEFKHGDPHGAALDASRMPAYDKDTCSLMSAEWIEANVSEDYGCMSQQMFDYQCVVLNQEKRKAVHALHVELESKKIAVKDQLHALDIEADNAHREYRDAIYDLATRYSNRSGEFVAGQVEAYNKRALALQEIKNRRHALENELFLFSRDLDTRRTQFLLDWGHRRAEVIRKYNDWIAERQQQRINKQ